MAPLDTRRRLLAAARALTARVGYANASVDEIAREAGLTKGAVYSRFKGKREILLSLIEDWVAETLAEFERARSTPFSAASAFVVGEPPYMEWRDIVPEFWRQAVDDEVVRDRVGAAYSRLRQAVASLFSGWRRSEEAGLVARTVLELHDGLLLLQSIGDPRASDILPADIERLLKRVSRQRREAPRTAAV
jgi:AcrR family transcriptional regulator